MSDPSVFFAVISCSIVGAFLVYAPFGIMIHLYKKRHGAKASQVMARRALRLMFWPLRAVKAGYDEERRKW